jgi:hypothetical protein
VSGGQISVVPERRVTIGIGIGVGVAIALAAAAYQLVLAAEPVNDHFMNVVWAREIVAGRLPVRDYFEAGEPLSELLSAAAEWIFGYRLLAEGLLVAVATGVATGAVYWLTSQATNATVWGAYAATLVLVAGTRSYSYPKVILYAVAGVLIWLYAQKPSLNRVACLSCWAALGFLWRHDHGAYLASAIVITIIVVHGVTPTGAVRIAQAGVLALLIVSPYLLWVQRYRGLAAYMHDGISVIGSEFADNAPFRLPAWPIRRPSDVLQVDPQSTYAPRVQILWSPDSTLEQREHVIERFRLRGIDPTQPRALGRLLDPSAQNIRGLLNDATVADTRGIDRGRSAVAADRWTTLDRLRFGYAPLRARFLPAFEDPERAAQGAAWLFLAVSLAALIWSTLLRIRPPSDARHEWIGIQAIAALALLVIPGLLRRPFATYAPDVIALPAVLAGWLARRSWSASANHARRWRFTARAVTVAGCSLMVLAVSSAGMFLVRVIPLAGSDARLAWTRTWRQLVVTPPVAFWEGQHPPTPQLLSMYVNRCTPRETTLFVIGFAPDVQYYSNRLLASRHLLLGRGRWTADRDQAASLAKLQDMPPPVVLAQEPFFTETFTGSYPSLAGFVRNSYREVGTLDDTNGHSYKVMISAALAKGRIDPQTGWPCGGQ